MQKIISVKKRFREVVFRKPLLPFYPCFKKGGLNRAILNLKSLVIFWQVISVSLDKVVYHLLNGVDIEFGRGVRVKHSRLIDVL